MRKYLYLVLLLPAVFVGGFFTAKNFALPSPVVTDPTTHAVRQSGYTYINPLLECDSDQSPENNAVIRQIKDSVQTLIDTRISSQLTDIAFYFRDLNNGPWTGINEGDVFTPASLLKTPMLMTYLKLAETNPQVLDQKLTFDTTQQLDSSVPNLETLKPHASYSVKELLERMIIYSDNNAFNLLTGNIDYQLVKKIHEDLGLTLPEENTPQDFISVKEYAGLFRILYNASYLNRDMSEKALDILAHAAYKDGLVAGVGDSVTISHKFGIRKGTDGVNQLHDCGIVYYPSHPYLICVMTKGKDFNELTRAIEDISHTVYTQFSSLYPR